MSLDAVKVQKRTNSIVEISGLIEKKQILLELELVKTKWYQYRFMSPHQATVLFKEVYARQFANQLSGHGFKGVAGKRLGVNEVSFYERGTEYVSFFGARQRADKYGLPYERYIEISFEFSNRRGRDRKKLPRPNQLGPSKTSDQAWWLYLEDYVKRGENSYLYRSFDPRKYATMSEEARAEFKERYEVGELLPWYRLENCIGLPAQTDFREFAVGEFLNRRTEPNRAIAYWVMKHALLPMTSIRTAMGRNKFKDNWPSFRSYLKTDPVSRIPTKKLGRTDLLPCCFSIPDAFDSSDTYCSHCSFAEECQQFAAQNTVEIIKRFGGDDPKLAKKRELSKLRTAKHRDKKSSAKAGI